MAIRIFGILIALFAVVFTILGLQDPYSLNLKAHSLNFKNIEANNLKAYELNSSSAKAFYQAQTWTRYQNKDIFEHFETKNLDFNLKANTLELLNDAKKMIFKGNVSYIGVDNTRIFSPQVEFLRQEKILNTQSGFKAYIKDNIINGNMLNYDLKHKILEVQGAKAWLKP